MVARLAEGALTAQHIRPLDPQRDLSALANLIEIAFGSDLALTGSRMVQDLREMALWGPALRLAQLTSRFLDGYVWIEDGQLVGNVTITEEPGAGVYSLSNVAVLPEFQGRGIAGALLDAAIEALRSFRGRCVLLQVRSDNPLAQALYRHRGFTRYDTLHEINLRPGRWPVVMQLPQGLRTVRRADAASLEALWRLCTPREALEWRPLHVGQFRRGLLWHAQQLLQMMLNGKELVDLVALDGVEVVGYAGINTCMWYGPHELTLVLHPGHRGRYEHVLLDGLFHAIRHVPRYSVRASISASYPEALQAAESSGFETLRVLDQMILWL
jgi:ribosomal protein S18 acetylase RimI-like enzyme